MSLKPDAFAKSEESQNIWNLRPLLKPFGDSGTDRNNEMRRILGLLDGHCVFCGVALFDMTGKRIDAAAAPDEVEVDDHLNAVSRGNPAVRGNMVPICSSCNSAKSDMTPMAYAKLRAQLGESCYYVDESGVFDESAMKRFLNAQYKRYQRTPEFTMLKKVRQAIQEGRKMDAYWLALDALKENSAYLEAKHKNSKLPETQLEINEAFYKGSLDDELWETILTDDEFFGDGLSDEYIKGLRSQSFWLRDLINDNFDYANFSLKNPDLAFLEKIYQESKVGSARRVLLNRLANLDDYPALHELSFSWHQTPEARAIPYISQIKKWGYMGVAKTDARRRLEALGIKMGECAFNSFIQKHNIRWTAGGIKSAVIRENQESLVYLKKEGKTYRYLAEWIKKTTGVETTAITVSKHLSTIV